jgi:transposase
MHRFEAAWQMVLAIYLMASDKRGISALRIAQHIGVSWITAQNMLRKVRKAMTDRDSIYLQCLEPRLWTLTGG